MKEDAKIEDSTWNCSSNNNHEVVAPFETLPPVLKMMVDNLQTQMINLVANHSSRIIELETEVRQLVANQDSLESKIAQLTANQNTNNGVENIIIGSTTTTSNDTDEYASNRNNEMTDLLISETSVREETTTSSLLKRKISMQRLSDLSLGKLASRQDEEIIFSTDDSIINKIDTVVNISATSPCEIDDDNVTVEHDLFTGSTHQFLFMNTATCSEGKPYKVGCKHKILASLVIIFQFIAYSYLGFLIIRDIKIGDEFIDRPTIEIDSKYCYDVEKLESEGVNNFYTANTLGIEHSNLAQASITAETLPSLLQCSKTTDNYNKAKDMPLYIVNNIISDFILWVFLLPELFQIFVLLKCKCWRSKLVGVVLLFITFFAFFVSFLANANLHNMGFLDTFFLIVGLIFIHDIDEQLFSIIDGIENVRDVYHCVTLQFGIFFSIVLVSTYCVIAKNFDADFAYRVIPLLEDYELV